MLKWEYVPSELIQKVLLEFEQKSLIKGCKLIFKGFREGKVPRNILLPKVMHEYHKSPIIQAELRQNILELLGDVTEKMKKIPVRSLEAHLPRLIAEYSGSRVYMAIFLDRRAGVRKLAPVFWAMKDSLPVVSSKHEDETTQFAENTQHKNSTQHKESTQHVGHTKLEILFPVRPGL